MKLTSLDIVDSKVWIWLSEELNKKIAYCRSKLETCGVDELHKYQEQIKAYRSVLDMPDKKGG